MWWYMGVECMDTDRESGRAMMVGLSTAGGYHVQIISYMQCNGNALKLRLQYIGVGIRKES